MRTLLAYPHNLVRGRPSDPADLVTVDWDYGGDWPNTIVGPDTQHVARAAQFLIEQDPDRIICMSEESVLVVGIANRKLGLMGPGFYESICCTSHLYKRRALKDAGLNPRWATDVDEINFPPPYVVRAGASTYGDGVGVVMLKEEIEPTLVELRRCAYLERARLRQVNIEPVPVFEEYISGTQYEVSGVSRASVDTVFGPLRQVWNESRGLIDAYDPEVDDMTANALVRAAVEAVDRLRLCYCPWNVELRLNVGNPVVIDIHARLGEDSHGYAEHLYVIDPALQAIEVLRK